MQVDAVVPTAAAKQLRRPVGGAGETDATVARQLPPLTPRSAQSAADAVGANVITSTAVKLLHRWQTVTGLSSAVCSGIRPVHRCTAVIDKPAFECETVLNDFPLTAGWSAGNGNLASRPCSGELHHPVRH